MGKNASPVVGYWYALTMHMGECIAADTLLEVRGGDRTAWQGALSGSGSIVINQPGLYGGEKSEGGLNGTLTVLAGDDTQMPSAALAVIEPGPRPAYRGLCTTVWDGDVGAMNKYVKALSKKWQRFTAGWAGPVWQPSLLQIDQGMNPAHIIYYVLTSPNGGSRDPATTMDLDKMLAAAQTLHDEGFGLCLKWTSSDSIGQFIQIICDHIGAMWVDDPTTGLAYLKLIRNDYDPATLPVLDESNILKMLSYQQATSANAVNQVTVTYHDPSTNKDVAVTAQSLANVQAQGRVISQSTSYPGLWNHDQGARAALRDCNVTSALLLKIKVKVKSGGPSGLYGTKKGDRLLFSWARKNLTGTPMLVLEVDNGLVSDNGITLTCAQDVFGLPSTTYLVSQPNLWTEPDLTPQPVPLQLLQEASYRDLAGYLRAADLAQVGSTSGYLTTIANRPNGVSLNYTIDARLGVSGTFLEVGSGSFAPTGVLAADVGPADTLITLTDVDSLALAKVGGEALIGSELVRVDAINLTTSEVTIARGCVDTVPATPAHYAGTQIWFTDNYTGFGKTEYLSGETVQAMLLTNTGLGRLDPSLATIGNVVFNSRQDRPYPPGNLKINGVAYPSNASGALVLTWAHRDRLLSADQLVDTTQGNIGPETGTTYTVKVYLGGTLDSTTTGITGTTLTLTVSASGTVRVDITAQRDGLDSWQALSATFGYVASALSISGAAPDGVPGTAYSFTYGHSGGLGPFTWSITAGALPPGISINPSTGEISGTPTTAGTYSWTVQVMDSLGDVASEPDGVTVAYATLTLSGTFPSATVGVAYDNYLMISGGATPYSLTGGTGIASGSLPAGLSLSIASTTHLRLSGTPMAAGTDAFTVSVDSTDSQTATSAQSITVGAALTYSAAVLADSPVLFHLLNETSGTTAANIGSLSGADATYTGGYTHGVSSGNTGIPVCTRLDGTTGYLVTPSIAPFASSEAISIEIWVRPTGSNDIPRITDIHNSVSIYGNSNSPGLVNSGAVSLASGVTIPTSGSALTQIAFTCDASGYSCYVNGVLVASTTSAYAPLNPSDLYYIGRYYLGGSGGFWKGDVAAHSVYLSKLSAARVLAHYNAGA